MRDVYSQQIAVADINATLLPLYTVPAGTVLIVRDIEAYNFGGVADKLYVTTLGAGRPTGFVWVVEGPASGVTSQWQGRLVLKSGDELQAQAVASTWSLMVSGYVLET